MNDLSALDAEQLTEVLRRRLAAVGGLATEEERDLARELVRRARRADRLEAVLRRLLAAGETLVSQGGAEQQAPWQAAAALAREMLQAGMGCVRLPQSVPRPAGRPGHGEAAGRCRR